VAAGRRDERAPILALRRRLYERFPVLHGGSASRLLEDGTSVVERLGRHPVPVLGGADLMSFRLRCGQKVHVESLVYQRTYAGFLEGRPDRWMTATTLEDLRKDLGIAPGRRGVHLVEPELDESYPEAVLLPPAQFTVQLESYDPVSPDRPKWFGSELRVVFYANNPRHDRLGDVIEEVVADLPWGDIAADVDYSYL
jgi:hypothetical protein